MDFPNFFIFQMNSLRKFSFKEYSIISLKFAPSPPNGMIFSFNNYNCASTFQTYLFLSGLFTSMRKKIKNDNVSIYELVVIQKQNEMIIKNYNIDPLKNSSTVSIHNSLLGLRSPYTTHSLSLNKESSLSCFKIETIKDEKYTLDNHSCNDEKCSVPENPFKGKLNELVILIKQNDKLMWVAF